MIIRARSLLPMGAAVVENGALVIDEGCINWMGRWHDLELPSGQKPLDLGEVVLMPGLINSHCHLDFTKMAGRIPPPKVFPDWIKTILSFKSHWSFSEFAESWLSGARTLLDNGTTTVADTESVPELLNQVWNATPLRVISFLEMTGVKTQRDAEKILDETLHWIESAPQLPGKQCGLSPHALYSTTPELMRKSAALAEDRNLLVSTHLAESESEFRMFRDASGPFHDWLKGQRRMDDCGFASPVKLAHEYGILSSRCLAIHANYLAPGDAELLARAGATVVHCPRSHEYFGHDPFPFSELSRAGVNVCLGTDSLATARKIAGQNPELNLWEEMRLFSSRHPGVSPAELLRMTTLSPAQALGKTAELGALRPGAFADFIAVPYSGPVSEARMVEEMVYSSEVRNVFVAGNLVKHG